MSPNTDTPRDKNTINTINSRIDSIIDELGLIKEKTKDLDITLNGNDRGDITGCGSLCEPTPNDPGKLVEINLKIDRIFGYLNTTHSHLNRTIDVVIK